MYLLLLLRWHFIFNISHQRYPHLCRIVTPQNIANKMRFDLHLNLKGYARMWALVAYRTTMRNNSRPSLLTISKAPRRTPHKILENHNSSCALPSSGNSTKSASGFSSKTRENWLLSLVQLVTVGEMLRKILNPTYSSICQSHILEVYVWHMIDLDHTFAIMSAVSRKLEHRPTPDFARKSSISRIPIL